MSPGSEPCDGVAREALGRLVFNKGSAASATPSRRRSGIGYRPFRRAVLGGRLIAEFDGELDVLKEFPRLYTWISQEGFIAGGEVVSGGDRDNIGAQTLGLDPV